MRVIILCAIFLRKVTRRLFERVLKRHLKMRFLRKQAIRTAPPQRNIAKSWAWYILTTLKTIFRLEEKIAISLVHNPLAKPSHGGCLAYGLVEKVRKESLELDLPRFPQIGQKNHLKSYECPKNQLGRLSPITPIIQNLKQRNLVF